MQINSKLHSLHLSTLLFNHNLRCAKLKCWTYYEGFPALALLSSLAGLRVQDRYFGKERRSLNGLVEKQKQLVGLCVEQSITRSGEINQTYS